MTEAIKSRAQVQELISDILRNEGNKLEQSGVKGMRWGVRKRDTSPTSVSVKETPGKKVKTSGGKNQPASSDAKKAAATRQKAKKSSTDSLSNAELKDLVTRMNLEQQYSNLSNQRSGGVKKFINTLLGKNVSRQANMLAQERGDEIGKILNDKVKKKT